MQLNWSFAEDWGEEVSLGILGCILITMQVLRFYFLIILKLLCGLMLGASLVSCSAFSSDGDDDDETVLESELDAEDELGAELDDVELTEDEDDDLASDDEDEDDEEDIDEEEEEDLDEEVADNDLDDEDDDDLDEDEDDEEDIDDDDFADIDDEDVDDVDEDDEFTDEDLETDEEALEKELGGKDYPETADAQPAFPEEVVKKEEAIPPPQTDSAAPPSQPGVITSQAMAPDSGMEPPEPTIPQDDLGIADPIVPQDEEPENNGWVPVVKVKTDPFFRNSRLMNAVYIARPGDTMSSISEKIYGDDKSKELLADNSHLEKGIDTGDKVYYNSPNRPEDKTNLKVFYDDRGQVPQNYITKDGDNMRRLGSKLLGFAEGWKEVWAINPNVDSKTVLKKGLDLRYWTGDEQTQDEIMMAKAKAEAEKPQPPPVEEPGPPPEDPQPPVVAEGLPPEPALPEAGTQAGIPQDPAMDIGAPLPEPVEPLPEADISEVPEQMPQEMAANTGDDSLLTVGVVGLLILAGVALVAIQIKNRKAQASVSPPSLEYTQV